MPAFAGAEPVPTSPENAPMTVPFLAALRMRALAYRYDYDSGTHERIIHRVRAAVGPALTSFADSAIMSSTSA